MGRRIEIRDRLQRDAGMRGRHHLVPGLRRQRAAGHLVGRGEVVIAEPDAANEVAGEAHEPGIAIGIGGACLAGGLDALQLGGAAGAALGYLREHEVHLRDGVGIEHLLGRRCITLAVVDEVARAVDDLGEGIGPGAEAAIGEHRISAGHVEHRDLGGAERQRLGVEDLGGDPHPMGELDDRVAADGAGESDCDGVQRMDQRRRQRDIAHEAAAIVLGRPVADRDRRILDDGLGRVAVAHRGGIDEGLEGRARLAERAGRAVELAFAIIAPARHRPDGAVGLRQHHRRLRDAVTFAGFAERTLDGIVDHALQTGIDRAAHDEAAVAIRHLPLHLLEGPVEEIVRRLARILAHDIGRRAAGGQHLPLRHEAGIDHVGQHLVGPGAGGGQVHMRRIAGRGLVEPGQHRGFGKVEIGDLLAEIEFGGRRGAEIPSAHIGAVEIELQDVVLGEVRLQPEREEGFLDLAVDGALVGKEEVLGELLRDRRTTLDDVVGAEVLEQRPRRTDDVDAEMRIEAAVLGGERRLDQMIGKVFQRDRVVVLDAAAADRIVVAVEEGHREIGLLQPVVVRGLVKSGDRERQHQQHAAEADGGGFRQRLDEHPALPAPDIEAVHERREAFVEFAQAAPGREQGGVDARVEVQQEMPELLLPVIGYDVAHRNPCLQRGCRLASAVPSSRIRCAMFEPCDPPPTMRSACGNPKAPNTAWHPTSRTRQPAVAGESERNALAGFPHLLAEHGG